MGPDREEDHDAGPVRDSWPMHLGPVEIIVGLRTSLHSYRVSFKQRSGQKFSTFKRLRQSRDGDDESLDEETTSLSNLLQISPRVKKNDHVPIGTLLYKNTI